jgi:hypothetical protein
MSEKTIPQRLFLKPGYRMLLLHAPETYPSAIEPLPERVTLLVGEVQSADLIQIFTANRDILEEELPKIQKIMTPNTLLWVTYHKGTSKIKTDINRDIIREYAQTLGLEAVAMISIDDDWSALRLKRTSASAL